MRAHVDNRQLLSGPMDRARILLERLGALTRHEHGHTMTATVILALRPRLRHLIGQCSGLVTRHSTATTMFHHASQAGNSSRHCISNAINEVGPSATQNFQSPGHGVILPWLQPGRWYSIRCPYRLRRQASLHAIQYFSAASHSNSH